MTSEAMEPQKYNFRNMIIGNACSNDVICFFSPQLFACLAKPVTPHNKIQIYNPAFIEHLGLHM